MQPRDVAARYVELIQAGRYDEVGELWADDAVFQNPVGTVIRGKAAIKAFYTNFLSSITPDVRAARYATDVEAGVCVLELETRMSRGEDGQWRNDPTAPYSLSAIDRFAINAEGKIQHMIVYTAPANRWLDDAR
jgi:hypothetical protein